MQARVLYVVFLSLLASCRIATHKSSNKPTASTQTAQLNQLQLAGSYASGIDLGNADFVVMRDCDATGKTCTNDILSTQDLDPNSDVQQDALPAIELNANDTGILQTIACKDEKTIDPNAPSVVDSTPPLGVEQTTKHVSIQNVDYACVVSVAPKNVLINELSSSSQSSSLELGDKATNALMGAAVGFSVGFAAGFALTKNAGANADTKYNQALDQAKTTGAKDMTFKQIVMTDFDGTQGLGDYDPHPTGYGKDPNRPLDPQEWEDFAKRKLGGNQGMKELTTKYQQYKNMTATQILADSDFGKHVPELKDLPSLKGQTINSLVEAGHMVKLNGNYYNAPTWLEGSIESLHRHIKANRLVMFNSTNFRPNVASLIEASMDQEFRNSQRHPTLGILDTQLRDPRQTEFPDLRAKNPSSTKTRFKNVYIGTAAALDISPPTSKSDRLNATISGTKVRLYGDKTAIAQRTFQEAVGDGARLPSEGVEMVSLDDKVVKANEFGHFAKDIGAKHVFIQSAAVKSSVPTEINAHIEASDKIFDRTNFNKIGTGETIKISDNSIKTNIKNGRKLDLSRFSSASLSPKATPSNAKAKTAGHGFGRSALSGILLGGVMGNLGAVFGASSSDH